jgi:hypothetical protein
MAGELGGRYRLLEVIGSGGMGRVWRADDTLLQRTVAIKELTTPASPLREARAAARLDHPGLVRVFDVLTTQDRAWIVMEHVPSRSLHRVVTEDGPLPPAETARIGLLMLAALRSAHAAGVLHRDVKPDNVLLASNGRVVLTDFGLATISGDGPDPRLGSPSYIAPERLLSREAGVAGDLWSFGATLYFAVEGRPPFTRGDGGAALRALISEPPDPPMLAGPLAPLLLALLDRDPDQRPSAAATEVRLQGAVDKRRPAPKRPVRLRKAPIAPTLPREAQAPPAGSREAVVPPAGQTADQPGWSRRIPASRRMRLALAGALTALVVTGGTALAAVAAEGPAEPDSPSTALMSYRVDTCGPGATTAPVTAATSDVPAGLPNGWVWFRDPAGFALALPAGWQRSALGGEVCFTDADGARAFTVAVAAAVAGEPLAYWQSRERAERARGDLPGYQRIRMDTLLLDGAGADWEYTWRPGTGEPRHERRVLIAAGTCSYLLRWTVADSRWAENTALQGRLVDFIQACH